LLYIQQGCLAQDLLNDWEICNSKGVSKLCHIACCHLITKLETLFTGACATYITAYLHERVWQVTAYTAFLALMWGARVSDLIVLPLRLLASDARILLRQAAACLSTSDWQVQNGYCRGSCSTGFGFGGAGGLPRLISGFDESAARSVTRLGFLDLAMRALRFKMPTGFFGMRLCRSDAARPTHLHLPQHVVDGSKVRNFGRLASCSSSRALALLGQC